MGKEPEHQEGTEGKEKQERGVINGKGVKQETKANHEANQGANRGPNQEVDQEPDQGPYYGADQIVHPGVGRRAGGGQDHEANRIVDQEAGVGVDHLHLNILVN